MPQRTNLQQAVIYYVKRHYAPPDVEVTQSKMLRDSESNEDREIDVVMEGMVGDERLTISIEVKADRRRAGTPWIDSMLGKHQRMPTSKLVLASWSGFSRPAQVKWSARLGTGEPQALTARPQCGGSTTMPLGPRHDRDASRRYAAATSVEYAAVVGEAARPASRNDRTRSVGSRNAYGCGMVRPSWSRRRNDEDIKAFFVLRDGVPDGLHSSLVGFVTDYLAPSEIETGRKWPNRAMIAQFNRINDEYLPEDSKELLDRLESDPDSTLLLNAVDFVLGTIDPDSHDDDWALAELQRYLLEARSAYTVGLDGDGRYELQDRQPEELSELVREAASATDRASEHLRRAWSKAFARTPDPNGACTEAVAAIEVAAKPVVSPTNTRVTLGTMIRDMKAKPAKWVSDSEADSDIEKVIGMMEFVWTGHFRHGDELKPINVSTNGAEMIVHIAAVLVHWFKAGRIRLR